MTPYKDKVTAAQATATLQENVVPAFNFGLASSHGLGVLSDPQPEQQQGSRDYFVFTVVLGWAVVSTLHFFSFSEADSSVFNSADTLVFI